MIGEELFVKYVEDLVCLVRGVLSFEVCINR